MAAVASDFRSAMVNVFLPAADLRRFCRAAVAALPNIKVNGAIIPPMDLSSIPLFAAITRRMGWLTERQTVLAENVANVNTPGYNEKDLKEPDFRALVQGKTSGVHLVATRPNHIVAKPGGEIDGTVETTADRTLNGNGVSIEAQMMKVSQNTADYSLTTTLYQKHIALIKTALGTNGSR